MRETNETENACNVCCCVFLCVSLREKKSSTTVTKESLIECNCCIFAARVCACVRVCARERACVCVCVPCARCSLSDWLADPSGLFGISPGPEGGGQRGERAGSEPEVNWGSPQE